MGVVGGARSGARAKGGVGLGRRGEGGARAKGGGVGLGRRGGRDTREGDRGDRQEERGGKGGREWMSEHCVRQELVIVQIECRVYCTAHIGWSILTS